MFSVNCVSDDFKVSLSSVAHVVIIGKFWVVRAPPGYDFDIVRKAIFIIGDCNG